MYSKWLGEYYEYEEIIKFVKIPEWGRTGSE
jgi:hypothetical protein